MLIVISDLHFEECESDALPRQGLQVQRNIHPRAFGHVLADLVNDVVLQKVQRVDFVLDGDVFDIHRTQLWFAADGSLKAGGPYTGLPEVAGNPALEAHVADILDRIIGQQQSHPEALTPENNVAGCLELIRRFPADVRAAVRRAHGDALADAMQIATHYIPGNHDRLRDATPALRRKVVAALGLAHDPARPFPRVFSYAQTDMPDQPRVLVRHGHEYDPVNFALAIPDDNSDIRQIDLADHYGSPTLGDLITVDIASRLPWEFRKYHTDQALDDSALLSAIYWRLLEFDDVRPQAALLDFVLGMSLADHGPVDVWNALRPVLRQTIERVKDRPFLRSELKRMGTPLRINGVNIARLLLATGAWRLLLALPHDFLASKVSALFRKAGGTRPEAMAQREEGIHNGSVRLVIAGHTHEPQVALLRGDRTQEHYFIDTGTWRRRIPSTPDGHHFGQLKAQTYVAVYGAGEDLRVDGREKTESFSWWSGLKRRWN